MTQGVRQPIYVYDEKTGIWVEKGEAIIQARLATFLAYDYKYKSHIIDECVKSIRQRNMNSDFQFNQATKVLVV